MSKMLFLGASTAFTCLLTGLLPMGQPCSHCDNLTAIPTKLLFCLASLINIFLIIYQCSLCYLRGNRLQRNFTWMACWIKHLGRQAVAERQSWDFLSPWHVGLGAFNPDNKCRRELNCTHSLGCHGVPWHRNLEFDLALVQQIQKIIEETWDSETDGFWEQKGTNLEKFEGSRCIFVVVVPTPC